MSTVKLGHAWAVTLRHIKLLIHDINIQMALCFWPFLDIVIWGYLGVWMQQGHNPILHMVLLGSIFLWQIVNRSSMAITLAFLEELWSNNLAVLFSTPLRLSEWMIGVITYSILTSAFLIVYCFALIKLMYAIPSSFLLHIGILFGPPLFLSSIALGFLALQVVLYRGKRATEFVFLATSITAPLSGVFYPREVLPVWIQKIGSLLPMSYIFSALRNYIMHGKSPFNDIIISYIASLFYCIVALLLFAYSFRRTKRAGLTRLMD